MAIAGISAGVYVLIGYAAKQTDGHRGDILMGMVHKNLFSEIIHVEMRLALMTYYLLTLDCFDEKHKNRLRKRIADILSK